jgi:hypothetical protein
VLSALFCFVLFSFFSLLFFSGCDRCVLRYASKSNSNILRVKISRAYGELSQGLQLQTAVQSPKSGMSNVFLPVAGRCWAGAGERAVLYCRIRRAICLVYVGLFRTRPDFTISHRLSACVWLNAAAAGRRGTSRPLVAAFASATLAGVRLPALARYPTNRWYLEGTSGVAGGMELEK